MSLFNEFLEVNGVEFRRRVAAKEPFTDEEMEVLLNNSIQEEITDVRRWTFSVRHILHIEEKFYELSYSEPKTEMNGDRDYYPSLITEVWPQPVMITKYVKNKSKNK